MANTTSTTLISSTTYDYLKYTVQIALPALGTLYFTLATLWGLPNAEQVVGTITAVALFGGVLIGVSKHQYEKSDEKFDGAMNVDHSADEEFRLEFKKELPELEDQNEIRLKVNKLSH